MGCEFIVWGTPVSHQQRKSKGWQEKVASAAREAVAEDDRVIISDLSLVLTFFHAGELAGDLDNLAKSTLDGMGTIAFGDDRQIAQLTLRRTCFDEPGFSILEATPMLAGSLRRAIDEVRDFVYVRVDPPPDHRRLP